VALINSCMEFGKRLVGACCVMTAFLRVFGVTLLGMAVVLSDCAFAVASGRLWAWRMWLGNGGRAAGWRRSTRDVWGVCLYMVLRRVIGLFFVSYRWLEQATQKDTFRVISINPHARGGANK